MGVGGWQTLTGHVHDAGDQLLFVVVDLLELRQSDKELQQSVVAVGQAGQLQKAGRGSRRRGRSKDTCFTHKRARTHAML